MSIWFILLLAGFAISVLAWAYFLDDSEAEDDLTEWWEYFPLEDLDDGDNPGDEPFEQGSERNKKESSG